ncbi:unnamed protein product [Lymnaea stagnalis]|uniref:Uncharacterized protein n=1 Tax=Lymnaea stagnalis TaxID=6523 RepID=A0AAV2IAH1_LYMST
MASRPPTLIKHHTNLPRATLSFISSDAQPSSSKISVASATSVEKEKKTVHFASEDEEVSVDQSTVYSQPTTSDDQTLMPSDNLYSGDTFLSLSQETLTDYTSPDGGTTIQSQPSYGSSTFIELDSQDETRTESDHSHTDADSFASSEVFSPSSSSSQPTIPREWKDVTEIVKDIEELEESEYVTRGDSSFLSCTQRTDSDSEDSEWVEQARQNFILNTIRWLKLHNLERPRSVSDDSESTLSKREVANTVMIGKDGKAKSEFCQKMIDKCKNAQDRQATVSQDDTRTVGQKYEKSDQKVLEHYGLSSAILDRLKMNNFQHKMAKKIEDLDQDIERSQQFVFGNQKIEEEIHRQKFLAHATACILRENTDDRIVDHLIRMQPEKWFADLIQDLPHAAANSREILHQYKQQLEGRRHTDRIL